MRKLFAIIAIFAMIMSTMQVAVKAIPANAAKQHQTKTLIWQGPSCPNITEYPEVSPQGKGRFILKVVIDSQHTDYYVLGDESPLVIYPAKSGGSSRYFIRVETKTYTVFIWGPKTLDGCHFGKQTKPSSASTPVTLPSKPLPASTPLPGNSGTSGCPPAPESVYGSAPVTVTLTGPAIFHYWRPDGNTPWGNSEVKIMITQGTYQFFNAQGSAWTYKNISPCINALPKEFLNGTGLQAISLDRMISLGLAKQG